MNRSETGTDDATGARSGAAPLLLHRETVRPEWVDYNGHMNVAYYVLVFDHATDAVLDHLDIGTAYRLATGGSVFVAEAHVTYEQEVTAGEPLAIASRVLGFDGKRLILFHEMRRGDGGADTAATGAGELVATNEVLCLHVDLTTRRSAPLPPDRRPALERFAAAHALLPRPLQAGRAIGLGSRRPR